MPARKKPNRGAIARARARYDAGEPLADLAQTFGVSQATFRAWRRRWDWPDRPSGTARRACPTPVAGKEKSNAESAAAVLAEALRDAPTDPDSQKALLRRLLGAEIIFLLRNGDARRGTEPQARALASISRTLALLNASDTNAGKKTDAGPDHDADAAPVDIAELRHELARRLHDLGAAEEDS